MKRFIRSAIAATAFLLLAGAPLIRAQAIHAASASGASVEDRRKALNAVFQDYWEDRLEHDPEFASLIGDLRYNDKISDYSVKAVNAELEREQNFLLRLAAIDPAGFTTQETTSRELLLRRLADDQEAADFKEWEMPVNQMDGIYDTYPQLVGRLSFKTVKDYDDWIARLHAIPEAFEQVIANMAIGIEDGRVPPKYLLEKVLEQVQSLAGQKPEDSPLALPLKKFPAANSRGGAGAHQDGDAGRNRKRSAARLHAVCALSEGELCSSGAQRAGNLGTAGRGKVLPVPYPAEDDYRSDCGSDSPDWAGRGEEGRGRDAGRSPGSWGSRTWRASGRA